MTRKDDTFTEFSRVKRLRNDPSLSRMKNLDDSEIHIGEPPDLQALARMKRMKSKQQKVSKMKHLDDETSSLSRGKHIYRETPHIPDDEKSVSRDRMKHLKEERPSLTSEHLRSKGYGVHSPRREERLSDSEDKTHHYNMDKIDQAGNEKKFHSKKLDQKRVHFNHLDRTHIKDKRSAMPKIYRGDEGHDNAAVNDANFEARLIGEGYFDTDGRRKLPEDFFENAASRH